MKNVGWIKLHRSIRDWKYKNDLRYFRVWVAMLLNASFEAREYEGIILDRGELIFTLRAWHKQFRDCRPEITIQNLRTIVKNLKKYGQIEHTFYQDKNFSKIRIINYEHYQQKDNECIAEKNTKSSAKTHALNNTHAASQSTHTTTESNTPSIKQKPLVEMTKHPIDKEETQLEIFDSLGNEDTNQHTESKNQHTGNQKSTHDSTLIKEEKKIKELKNFKNIESPILKKYSKKFIKLAKQVIDDMNQYLIQVNIKPFDPLDEILVLKPLHVAYKLGYKDLEQYQKVNKYIFGEWKNKSFPDGRLLMKNFTPKTLYKRNMAEYTRQAESFAFRPIERPQDANYGNPLDYKKLRRDANEEEGQRQKEIFDARIMEYDKDREAREREFIEREKERKRLKEVGKLLTI